MNVTTEPARPIAATRALQLYKLFDDVAEYGYARVELMESTSPGAYDALKAWAEAYGHQVSERSITPPDSATLSKIAVRVRRSDGYPGAHLSVQREVLS